MSALHASLAACFADVSADLDARDGALCGLAIAGRPVARWEVSIVPANDNHTAKE